VDQFAEPAVVAAISDSARERTFDTAADGAAPLTVGLKIGVRRQHNLAANRADFPLHGSHTIQAIEADGKTRNLKQRLAAYPAIRGKQDTEETASGAAGPCGYPQRNMVGEIRRKFVRSISRNKLRKIIWNNRRPCIGLASPDLVLTTAEDGLLMRPLTEERANPTDGNKAIQTAASPSRLTSRALLPQYSGDHRC